MWCKHLSPLPQLLATVSNCATWRAPWTSTVCFAQSCEVEIVARRTAGTFDNLFGACRRRTPRARSTREVKQKKKCCSGTFRSTRGVGGPRCCQKNKNPHARPTRCVRTTRSSTARLASRSSSSAEPFFFSRSRGHSRRRPPWISADLEGA